MKLHLALALVLFSSAALAAPKPEAEGVYNADATVSHAPPRATHALVEPNGEIWITDAWYGNSYQVGHVITGKIQPKKGDGSAETFLDGDVIPLSVSTVITGTSIRFTFAEFVQPFHPALYLHAPVQGKPSAFDRALQLQPDTKPVIQPDLYLDGSFSISVVPDGSFSGTDGNCIFIGKFTDAKGPYRNAALTYKNDCYLDAGPTERGVTYVSKGTKAEGVLFASTRYPGFASPVSILVLIMRAKTFSFAHFF